MASMIVSAALRFQAATVAAEGPSLSTVISAFAGVMILFVLRAVLESRDGVRSLKTALYGEKDATERSGLIHETRRLRAEVAESCASLADHTTKEVFWQETITKATTAAANRSQATLTDIDTRLQVVEKHCIPKPLRRSRG